MERLSSMAKSSVVELIFYDHSECDGKAEPFKCVVWGKLYKETKLAYYVCSWLSQDDPEEDNSKTFCILKSAVIKKKVLR
jgi:hypothetical protein